MLNVEPNRAIPYVLSVLPKRLKDLIEKLDPQENMSSKLRLLASTAIPYTDTLLPNRENVRKLSPLPI
jgi:hypothetical protein